MKICYIFSKNPNITQNEIYISNHNEAIKCNEKLKYSVLFNNDYRYIYFYLFSIDNNIKLHKKYQKIKLLNIYYFGLTISDLHSILNKINNRKILKKDRYIKHNNVLIYNYQLKKIGDFLNEMMFVDIKKFDYNKYAIYITNLF